MLLEALAPNFAMAQQVKPDDARLDARFVEIDAPAGNGKARGYLVRLARCRFGWGASGAGNGKARGYLVRPKGAAAKLPAVLVVHENRGLNPHIEDVTRRLALENFVAFAPDALFPLGGYPGNEDKAREAFAKLDQPKTREDFVASAEWLRAQPGMAERVGVVGFCYGGAMSNLLAARLPWLAAAVPFYGGSEPTAADAGKIKAAVMIHNAETDDWVNAGAAAYEQALKGAAVRFEAHNYPGTQHGFHNDTTPRYDEAAAKLAWQRTLGFFNRYLRG